MIFQLLFKRSSNNLRSLWERCPFLQFFRKVRPGWGKHEQRAKGNSWAMPTPHPHFVLASTHLKKKSDNFFAGLAPTYFRLLKLHSASAAVWVSLKSKLCKNLPVYCVTNSQWLCALHLRDFWQQLAATPEFTVRSNLKAPSPILNNNLFSALNISPVLISDK